MEHRFASLLPPQALNTSITPNPVWYPTNVSLKHAESTVRWVDLSGMVFDEPFFHHTVKLAAGRESVVLPLGSTPPGPVQPSIAPSAFVFHVSRCGSTLLCNIFRALNDAHVVAEPQPVTSLLTPYFEDVWPYAADEWEQKRDELLLQMMQRLGQSPVGSASRYIVKFTSYSATRMAIIRALWPQVPMVFLVREPEEVMASNLDRSPVWMKMFQKPRQARNVFGWADDIRPATREEFAARAYGQLCESATFHKGQPSLVMDYQELVSGGWNRIFAFLGFGALDDQEKVRIAEATKIYSKDAAGELPFASGDQDRLDRITPEIREAADKWARPQLQKLLNTAG